MAALARLRAVEAESDFFLVVGADRVDAAAHAGNTTALEGLYADLGAAVRSAVQSLAFRPDVRVFVTGDHETVLGTQLHSNASVPLLAYGLRASLPASVQRHVDVAALL